MEDQFWTHDTFLFAGAFRYYRDKKQPVRGKLHVSEEKYWNDGHELITLTKRQGVRSYVMMHPYVIEPNLVMSMVLHPKAKQYADAAEAIGETTGGSVDGLHDVQIGNAQAWYYPEDK